MMKLLLGKKTKKIMRLITPRDKLKEQIEETCRLDGDFELRSGQRSNFYFDKYLFESNPDLLYQICWQMKHQISNDFDYVAGLEVGGIPVATMLGFLMNKPVLFVRKKQKEYGTKKLAEGPNFHGKRLCVVEDVVTSGGQVLKSCKDLKELGGTIVQIACVILRSDDGKKNIEDAGYKLYNLFDFNDS